MLSPGNAPCRRADAAVSAAAHPTARECWGRAGFRRCSARPFYIAKIGPNFRTRCSRGSNPASLQAADQRKRKVSLAKSASSTAFHVRGERGRSLSAGRWQHSVMAARRGIEVVGNGERPADADGAGDGLLDVRRCRRGASCGHSRRPPRRTVTVTRWSAPDRLRGHAPRFTGPDALAI